MYTISVQIYRAGLTVRNYVFETEKHARQITSGTAIAVAYAFYAFGIRAL